SISGRRRRTPAAACTEHAARTRPAQRWRTTGSGAGPDAHAAEVRPSANRRRRSTQCIRSLAARSVATPAAGGRNLASRRLQSSRPRALGVPSRLDAMRSLRTVAQRRQQLALRVLEEVPLALVTDLDQGDVGE